MATTVSDEFKAMCKSNTPSGAIGRIKVIEDDIEIKESTDIQNIEIEDNCYVNDKFIGTTVAKKVTVNLFNDDNVYDLEDKEIEVKSGFELNGNEELISHGNFIIEKPNTEEVQAKTNFIGYDYMIKFNVPFVDNNTYPVELGTYFSNLCTQVGLVAGNTDFINSDYLVKGNPFTNNEDCRTVLSAIAQIAGGIAKIGRDNKVYIINLSKEDALHEIDGNNYDTFTPNKVFGPVNKVILKMNSEVNGEESVRPDEESISQNGECAITISDNPILTSKEERELVIDNIFNAIKGITYLPFKTTYYGYPYADSTDKAKISNVNDTEYNSYIFNHTISYDGSFSGSIETSALTKTQSMYKNTLDLKSRFRRTELAVDKINGKITSIIEQQDEHETKITQQEQDIDSLKNKVSNIQDLTRTITANKTIMLENCAKGDLLSLWIKGNNEVFKYLYPSDTLYPSNTLYPYGDSRISVIDKDNNEIVYELGVTDILRQNGKIYDEFILENGQAKVIRRINEDGTVKATEITEDLGKLSIPLNEGINTIKIKNYSAEIGAKYVVKSDYTEAFATRLEMNSSIEQTAEGINQEVRKKVDENEVISKINQTAEEVSIDANRININGAVSANGNFKIDTERKYGM